jgi:hypothetical protein
MKLFLNGRVIASLLAMTFYLAACGDGGSLPGNGGPVAEVDPKVSGTDVPTSPLSKWWWNHRLTPRSLWYWVMPCWLPPTLKSLILACRSAFVRRMGWCIAMHQPIFSLKAGHDFSDHYVPQYRLLAHHVVCSGPGMRC